MKGCITVIIIALLAGAGIFYFVWQATKPLAEEADTFFGLVGANKQQEAYDRTAAAFKKQTDFDSFRKVVAALGLEGYQSSSWSSRKINNGQGRLEGTVTTKDGRSFGMQVDFQQEDSRWKVLGLRPVGEVPKPAGGNKTSEQPSPAATPSPVAVASPSATAPAATPGGAQPSGERTAPATRTAPAGVYDSNGEVPPANQLKAMVEDTLLNFNDAIQAKDFSGFYQTFADRFKQQFTADKLNETFKPFVDKHVDISAIKGQDPEFTKEPEVQEQGDARLLVLEGRYGSSVDFNLKYIEENGKWALFGINVHAK